MFQCTVFVTVAALLLSMPQATWRHVHAHGHDEHHAVTAFHVHNPPGSATLSWRTHGPDDDARSIAGLLARSPAGPPGQAVALVPALPVLQAPAVQRIDLTHAASRGHDPPAHASSSPRAPPADLA